MPIDEFFSRAKPNKYLRNLDKLLKSLLRISMFFINLNRVNAEFESLLNDVGRIRFIIQVNFLHPLMERGEFHELKYGLGEIRQAREWVFVISI